MRVTSVYIYIYSKAKANVSELRGYSHLGDQSINLFFLYFLKGSYFKNVQLKFYAEIRWSNKVAEIWNFEVEDLKRMGLVDFQKRHDILI